MTSISKDEKLTVGDKVYIFAKDIAGKITSIDHNNIYYVVDSDKKYHTARFSEIRKIYNYKTGDRVYHIPKCQYGRIDSISSGNVLSVVFDNNAMVSYVSYDHELVPAFDGEVAKKFEEKKINSLKIGDEVTYVNSPGVMSYTVIKIMGDKVRLKGQYSEFDTSIFLLEKTDGRVATKPATKENIRMAVAASWVIDNGEKTYRLLNVKTLASMMRNQKLDKLKAVMVKTGVKYPGTQDIENEDIEKFSEMFQEAQDKYEM